LVILALEIFKKTILNHNTDMSKKAFTIIELVIVIGVLIILIGITVPRIKGMRDSAKIVQVKKELSTLQSAIESYYTFTGKYPSLGAYANFYNNLTGTYLSTTTPQLITSVLYDPFNAGHEYTYLFDGNKEYTVLSVGPSGSGAASSVGPSCFCLTGAPLYATNSNNCYVNSCPCG